MSGAAFMATFHSGLRRPTLLGVPGALLRPTEPSGRVLGGSGKLLRAPARSPRSSAMVWPSMAEVTASRASPASRDPRLIHTGVSDARGTGGLRDVPVRDDDLDCAPMDAPEDRRLRAGVAPPLPSASELTAPSVVDRPRRRNTGVGALRGTGKPSASKPAGQHGSDGLS